MKPYNAIDKIKDSIYFFRQLLLFKNRIVKKVTLKAKKEVIFDSKASDLLASLFNYYGSDKSTHHDYHEVYASILPGSKRFAINKIFEIGIGSNDISVNQNMGENGIPGASLRAFRDWAPNSLVIGADIDMKTMFNEDRITTIFIDQLDLQSFFTLGDVIGNEIELVVIDGLHTPRADLNSLIGVYPLVSKGGTVVIEDISPKAALLLWSIAFVLLCPLVEVRIQKRKNGFIFTFKK